MLNECDLPKLKFKRQDLSSFKVRSLVKLAKRNNGKFWTNLFLYLLHGNEACDLSVGFLFKIT